MPPLPTPPHCDALGGRRTLRPREVQTAPWGHTAAGATPGAQPELLPPPDKSPWRHPELQKLKFCGRTTFTGNAPAFAQWLVLGRFPFREATPGSRSNRSSDYCCDGDSIVGSPSPAPRNPEGISPKPWRPVCVPILINQVTGWPGASREVSCSQRAAGTGRTCGFKHQTRGPVTGRRSVVGGGGRHFPFKLEPKQMGLPRGVH